METGPIPTCLVLDQERVEQCHCELGIDVGGIVAQGKDGSSVP